LAGKHRTIISYGKRSLRFLPVLAAAFLLAGCAGSDPLPSVIDPEDSELIEDYGPLDYDSEDAPLLIDKNVVEKTLTFLNLDLGKEYTLNYDGTSCFYDKYGTGLSLDQVSVGNLVDVRFVKDSKHLTSLSLSKRGWKADTTDKYLINASKQEITIGEDVYRISSNARFFSGTEQIHLQDINSLDQLSFQGVDNMIYAATVERGHGYLRLSGQQYFVGGWLQVGLKLVQQVTEDMLIPVAEGAYEVVISNNGMVADRKISVSRNAETTLDLSDVQPEAPKVGQVIFTVTPEEAEVYVDGKQMDATRPVDLTYGIHQLICRAAGYKSVTRYISVGQASAGISVELEVSDGTDDEEDTGDIIATYYQVHVDAPEGAELYLDGSYVGIVPCSFKKVSGTHVLTLSRKGYITRSYTVTLDTEEKDASYSFEDLEKDGDVSGNDDDDKDKDKDKDDSDGEDGDGTTDDSGETDDDDDLEGGGTVDDDGTSDDPDDDLGSGIQESVKMTGNPRFFGLVGYITPKYRDFRAFF
jgi:hypothetical protein